MSTQHLPSPAASVGSPHIAVLFSPLQTNTLPVPRTHPLKPGSSKQIALINHLDNELLGVTRRYAKKFTNEQTDGDDAPGYTSYDQVVNDLNPVFELVWISGTLSLQIPYLLSIAGLVASCMEAFNFSESVFTITAKLDEAFATLITATANVPRSSMHRVTTTDKVRIRSLIEETRVIAVNVASESGYTASIAADTSDVDMDTDITDESDRMTQDSPQASLSIPYALSQIYKRTLELLGDNLV